MLKKYWFSRAKWVTIPIALAVMYVGSQHNSDTNDVYEQSPVYFEYQENLAWHKSQLLVPFKKLAEPTLIIEDMFPLVSELKDKIDQNIHLFKSPGAFQELLTEGTEQLRKALGSRLAVDDKTARDAVRAILSFKSPSPVVIVEPPSAPMSRISASTLFFAFGVLGALIWLQVVCWVERFKEDRYSVWSS